MKKAIYPGSFNPWHKGHRDILDKALKIFDKVIVAQFGYDKNLPDELYNRKDVDVFVFDNLLPELLKHKKVDAVIRGLRNGMDLQYEQNLLYWYEDLGMKIPVVYFVCDRNLAHISSSAIREIDKIKKQNNA